MVTIPELEFINRGSELTLLKAYLQRPRGAMPAAIIIRSPPGVGKSRLTDQLSMDPGRPELLFCIVDPDVQGNSESRLHEGFFVQRCAERLNWMASAGEAPWATLRTFLQSRRLKTAKEKRPSDLIADLPGPRSAYKLFVDYASRLLSLGEFAPDKLLTSDRSEAVRLCEEYAEFVLTAHPLALIVREVQHCDHRSLRTLVRWTESMLQLDLLIEYTSQTGEFEHRHQKLLYPLTALGRYFYTFDLINLEQGHLEHLIRTNVRSDFSIEVDAYTSWNGNLRSLVEVQVQVTVGQRIASRQQIGEALCDLTKTIEAHISSLPSLYKVILAICSAHVESVDGAVLSDAISRIAPLTSPLLLGKALSELIDTHRFLIARDGVYRIHNESVADALLGIPAIRPVLAAAEKALRDYYSEVVFESKFDRVGASAAVRQFFRLCASTKDVVRLLRATEVLSDEVENAQDPSLYVEIIGSAVAATPQLYADDHDVLLGWAGSLAYSIGDFPKADGLLSQMHNPDTVCLVMRACALSETGGHDEALSIASALRRNTAEYEHGLVADLIEGLIAGCCGDKEGARRLLTGAIENRRYSGSPLLGYAFRFFEVVENYAGCIEYLERSILWFDKFNLQKAKAFSQAAAAVLVARMGKIAEGRAMIDEAVRILGLRPPSRHLLLNNMAAVELLSETPDAENCKRLLGEAIRYVRDDFSEVTILSNLSLAHWIANETAQAVDCVDKVMQIIGDHDFADQEIYWPVCFNAGQVMNHMGFPERAEEIMRIPGEQSRPPEMNREYWDFRFGNGSLKDERYGYLASRPYHPLYLSSWLFESDGLSLLRQEQPQ